MVLSPLPLKVSMVSIRIIVQAKLRKLFLNHSNNLKWMIIKMMFKKMFRIPDNSKKKEKKWVQVKMIRNSNIFLKPVNRIFIIRPKSKYNKHCFRLFQVKISNRASVHRTLSCQQTLLRRVSGNTSSSI